MPEIFRDSGESGFRRAEHSALRDLLRELRTGAERVVALGGGAFVQKDNAALVGAGGVPTVFLDAGVEELWQRCRRQAEQQRIERPLLGSLERFRELYEARRPHYLKASFRQETGGKTVQEIAAEVIQALGLGPGSRDRSRERARRKAVTLMARMRWGTVAVLACAAVLYAGDKKDKPTGAKQMVDSGSFGVFVKGQRVVTETFSVKQENGISMVKSQLQETGGSASSGQKSELHMTSSGDLVNTNGAMATVLWWSRPTMTFCSKRSRLRQPPKRPSNRFSCQTRQRFWTTIFLSTARCWLGAT